MIDRENVITEIVERIEATLAVDSEYVTIPLDLLQYALSMLKEQDAVEPRWFVDAHNPAGAFQCSACRERIIEKNIDFYCPNCGKPILWEGR